MTSVRVRADCVVQVKVDKLRVQHREVQSFVRLAWECEERVGDKGNVQFGYIYFTSFNQLYNLWISLTNDLASYIRYCDKRFQTSTEPPLDDRGILFCACRKFCGMRCG